VVRPERIAKSLGGDSEALRSSYPMRVAEHQWWRKPRLGGDANTHEIVAVELTPDNVGDIPEIPHLLEQVDTEFASIMADGACDGGG
jgi:hypothetical protein